MTFTSSQLKAARALAGWSQKELATEAKLAQSTIADFERCIRIPHPNNTQSIIDAFDRVGILISEKEVVDMNLSKVNKPLHLNGMPNKYINAKDLSGWAERLDARSTIPELLRRLIRASLGSDAKPHFPSGESVQGPGCDGICYSKKIMNSFPSEIHIGSVG